MRMRRGCRQGVARSTVDMDWRPVDVEASTVEVNGNGHCDARGPTVELVPGNGPHEESDEPQRLLFSWAEFMVAEPVQPKRRSREPQPASMSMFEWAFEREREAAQVGAGR